MLQGTSATSLRKQDLTNQKNTATGFVKTQFANQFAGGETGVNLNSLTLPTSMATNGFTNPSGAQLAAANLTTYRKNLKLVYVSGTTRKDLVDYIDYTVSATGSQINFIGITAAASDILIGYLDYTAVSGIQVVSATGQPATGILAAGTTDFNIGFPVPTNQYSTTQLGGVLVYKDGILQTRNTGNSSTTLDGNYYEVDNGSGNFSVIRFNVSDPVNAYNILVVPNGLLVPQPDGSLLTTVQAQAGQINQLASYVAALTGLSTTTVLGGAASYTDLLAFGNTVNTLNNNAALKNVSNVWTASQALPGNTTGAAVATGYVGEQLRAFGSGVTIPNSGYTTIASVTLTPGVWDVNFTCYASAATSLTGVAAGIATATNTNTGFVNGDNAGFGGGTATNGASLSISQYRILVTTNTTYYLTATPGGATTTTASGRLSAIRVA